MRWNKLIERYTRPKRPVLKAMNPRFGTSSIPLNQGDEMIFFNYLQDKVHSLYFDGAEEELLEMIKVLEKSMGIVIHKMNLVEGRHDRLMHIHLGLPNTQEIRRIIKLPG